MSKPEYREVIDEQGVRIKYPAQVYAALPTQDIEAHVKQLEGRVLTALDAAIPEGQQNKAVKDVVRGHFKAKLNDIYSDSTLYDGTKYSAKGLVGIHP